MRPIDADAIPEELLNYELDGKWSGRTVRNLIDGQQTIQAFPPWIPCKERLPAVKERVLVTLKDGSMAIRKCYDKGHIEWFYANAVAWMPAPERYEPAPLLSEPS